ncbi:MAG: hypothetical protein JSV50_05755 [Desulfobacteraceae bacterium]|nr:MAG: hypothetical protein JSV50_05755 [Desulfobacteraceae bacterium]
MKHSSTLMLDDQVRDRLWSHIISAVNDYMNNVSSIRVAPELNPEKIRLFLKQFDFDEPKDPVEAVDIVLQGLLKYQVHTPHPRYFGLFNPAPTTMGVVADTIVAAFNPQLAAWSHSPFAAEIEQLLVHALGNRLGYEPSRIDGTFASGGAEANHTAILTALVKAFPQFAVSGLRGLDCQPAFYVSNQSHHSFIKAARFCGLGTDAVREIPVDDYFQMDVGFLTAQIKKDRSENFFPFMVVATAGTTSAGIIDPIAAIAKVATAEGLWLHVDAAWGGAALLVPELRRLFKGIERADSITFDAHKWLSVPMAAGLYLTRHIDILSRTCCFTATYMPRDAIGLDVVDPYTHSMQWSRRFIGLKLFLSLAIAGWDGYETTIRHQVEMGQLLRRELRESNWKVVNKTDLPVVCFIDQKNSEGHSFTYLEGIAHKVVSSGNAWISISRLDENTPALRACITNYRTEPEDVIALVRALNEARKSMTISP